jgi:hypothetical protein
VDFQFFSDLVDKGGNVAHFAVAAIAYGTYIMARKVLALLASINENLAALRGPTAAALHKTNRTLENHGQLLHSIRTQNTAILAAAKKAAGH